MSNIEKQEIYSSEISSVEISDELKSKIPENFNVSEIGNINLFEAEEIANEEIMVLTEKDLLLDLEKMPLGPVSEIKSEQESLKEEITPPDESKKTVPDQTKKSDIDIESIEQVIEKSYPEKGSLEPVTEKPDLTEIEEPVVQKTDINLDEGVIETEDHIEDEYEPVEEIEVKEDDEHEEILIIDEDGETLIGDMEDIELLESEVAGSYYDTTYRDLESVPGKFEKKSLKKESEDQGDTSSFEDTEIEFIDNSIIKDDFGRFILEIDEYSNKSEAGKSKAGSIYGIDDDELDNIETSLFKKEIENSELIKVDRIFNFFDRPEPDKKNTKFYFGHADVITEQEKESIEEDISTKNAIVFEEDIKEIKDILGTEEFVEPIAEDISSESEFLKPEKIDEEEIIDITDRVIILEDDTEREEFTNKFPDKKEDLTKLFTYLDGLFEKLPEEIIMKFADSEYFDLYMKVINDMEK